MRSWRECNRYDRGYIRSCKGFRDLTLQEALISSVGIELGDIVRGAPDKSRSDVSEKKIPNFNQFLTYTPPNTLLVIPAMEILPIKPLTFINWCDKASEHELSILDVINRRFISDKLPMDGRVKVLYPKVEFVSWKDVKERSIDKLLYKAFIRDGYYDEACEIIGDEQDEDYALLRAAFGFSLEDPSDRDVSIIDCMTEWGYQYQHRIVHHLVPGVLEEAQHHIDTLDQVLSTNYPLI